MTLKITDLYPTDYKSDEAVNMVAESLYNGYCRDVGGKAFNGDPLPDWEIFKADPTKTIQSTAWANLAYRAINMTLG